MYHIRFEQSTDEKDGDDNGARAHIFYSGLQGGQCQ